jgi:hypothetical protein
MATKRDGGLEKCQMFHVLLIGVRVAPSKAKQKLGWVPEITVQEMCAEVVREDLGQTSKAALLKNQSYKISISAK